MQACEEENKGRWNLGSFLRLQILRLTLKMNQNIKTYVSLAVLLKCMEKKKEKERVGERKLAREPAKPWNEVVPR